MKTLLLLRHAKSGWKDAEMRDFDRPLTVRGRRASSVIGRYLRKRLLIPGLVISSPAERARETTAIVLKTARIPAELRYDERIYEAHVGRLLEVVSQADASVDTVLMVGHNPGFSDFAQYLTGDGVHMPTAALAQIALDVEDWRQVVAGCGELKKLIKPRELTE
jgi:phosphohistidine phosphatase